MTGRTLQIAREVQARRLLTNDEGVVGDEGTGARVGGLDVVASVVLCSPCIGARAVQPACGTLAVLWSSAHGWTSHVLSDSSVGAMLWIPSVLGFQRRRCDFLASGPQTRPCQGYPHTSVEPAETDLCCWVCSLCDRLRIQQAARAATALRSALTVPVRHVELSWFTQLPGCPCRNVAQIPGGALVRPYLARCQHIAGSESHGRSSEWST